MGWIGGAVVDGDCASVPQNAALEK